MSVGVTYNERSWAIDLIGFLKYEIQKNNRSVKEAGGEQTIRKDGGSLFPDVLLFGDLSNAVILQGWELKMPDTSIDDLDFYENAKHKADCLGLDSFILWNVTCLRLYVRVSKEKEAPFRLQKEWNTLAHITDRSIVKPRQSEWQKVASDVLGYVADLFDRGSLEGRRFIEAYKSGGVTSLILENTCAVAMLLEQQQHKNSHLRNEINLWWEQHEKEYSHNQQTPFLVLAQVNLSNWVGKFLFAHILQGIDSRAQAISNITEEASPKDVLNVFKSLSETCNFWTVFQSTIGLDLLPERAWKQLIELNKLLSDLRIQNIEQSQLSEMLESMAEVPVRRIRGQYPTPIELARLLVGLCMNDITKARILDPCCGSGTIPRVVLERKLEAGVEASLAASSVFAGDKDLQAVQISTFSMARANLINHPIRLFHQDAFMLPEKEMLEFRNPKDGTLFSEKVGQFDAIVSNLPFVSQAGQKHYQASIDNVISGFSGVTTWSRRADLAAYLPLALEPLVKTNGNLGLIITNAWLGTEWGDCFFEALKRQFYLKYVITSGAGRWFQNSKVVTNILVFEKTVPNEDDLISFVTLKRPIKELSLQGDVDKAVAQIQLNCPSEESMSIRTISFKKLEHFRQMGLGGNAQFVNCDWLENIPLVKITNFFDVKRGERRGWNPFFYPCEQHNIEQEYIKPVLKSSRDIRGYITQARREAFCCSKSMHELEEQSHIGAISWIKKFKNVRNGAGRPLVDALSRAGMFWYQMNSEYLSDLVMPQAFDERLFVSKLEHPSFVDQRLFSFKAKQDVDIELCHALLNSSISLFMIEGIGYGRGEGALDLKAERIASCMQIPNASILSFEQAVKIKEAFRPLKDRDVFKVSDEFDNEDRRRFDQIVLDSFGVKVPLEVIYTDIKILVSIRLEATQSYE